MDFLFHLLSVTGMTLFHHLGYNVLFGKGKVFHFGPLAVSLVAAYTTFLTLGTVGTYWIAIPVGVLATVVVSLVFTWLSLRLQPDSLGVLTLAMHLAALAVVLNWTSVTRGALGLPQIPRMSLLMTPFSFMCAVLATVIVWGTSLWLLDRSAFGRKLSALAEHDWHAASMGVNRARVHAAAFIIAGIGAFLSNLFFMQYLSLVHPNDFGFPAFIFIIMAVVAGKPGSTLGVIVSTVLLVALRESIRFVPLSASVLGPVRLILFGVILFIAIWWRRDSLFPQQRRV